MVQLLQGITILDFTRLLPGPLATLMLQQKGARVIRMEHPERSDLARQQPPFLGSQSTLFATLNTGKETLSLDYTTEAGRKRVLELLPQADVVVEQFRPGIMSRWGLDWPTLKKEKPNLIYVSLTGYGQTGHRAPKAGHDINYLALAGLLDMNRDQNGAPVLPGVQLADICSGSSWCAMAVVSGLFHRERTGQGSYHDVSMLDGLLPLLTIPFTQHQGGLDTRTTQFLSGALANYNVYQTADDRWMALGALEMKFWNAFCDWAKRPEWKRQHIIECSVHVFPVDEIQQFFRSRAQAAWIEALKDTDFCLTPVRTVAEVLSDPDFLRKQSLEKINLSVQDQLLRSGATFYSTTS